MLIDPEIFENEKVRMEDLTAGDVFIWNENLCMKATIYDEDDEPTPCASGHTHHFVVLKDGRIDSLMPCAMVIPIDAKVVRG